MEEVLKYARFHNRRLEKLQDVLRRCGCMMAEHCHSCGTHDLQLECGRIFRLTMESVIIVVTIVPRQPSEFQHVQASI